MTDYYGHIYGTTNLTGGLAYIDQHCRSSFDEKYFGSGVILNRAIKKYGIDNFNVEVIEFCKDKVTLNNREIYYITHHVKTGKIRKSMGHSRKSIAPHYISYLGRGD